MTTETLLTEDDIRRMLQIGTRAFNQIKKDGRLPEAIQLGDRIKRWRATDIQAWIANRCEPIEPVGGAR